ncbi:MAG: orotate phosphoribosyltransferase [Omnitrophica WOR_2 bacterium RIFCSPHIGHO2_02_FULL_68_15]|nr:MAG: orotate phosphoribosyltransferase [Omnitrophica WOR_2 bacterium RIFCSPHIGHO2_02_FULL_68_15]
MRPSEAFSLLQGTGALLDGHFELSSGLHSRQYIQCASVLQHPTLAARLCGSLAQGFSADEVSVVAGPALGGITVAYELARQLGARAIFAERAEGKLALRRMFRVEPEDRVLLAEDVVTTGESTLELLELIQHAGATVVGMTSIVDRSGGAVEFPVKYHSLLALTIKTFSVGTCPLCKEEIPLTKPGTRPPRKSSPSRLEGLQD